MEIYLGVYSSQFNDNWPKLWAKTWGREEMKIYMEKGQIHNKINKNPLKMSNSLDKIYLGGLKSYIISI